MHCTNIQDVRIPNAVVHIGDSAFYGCERLRQLTICGNMPKIHSVAFYGCHLLNNIIFLTKDASLKGMKEFLTSLPCPLDKITIHGHKNSTAEKYAKKYRLKFNFIQEAVLQL